MTEPVDEAPAPARTRRRREVLILALALGIGAPLVVGATLYQFHKNGNPIDPLLAAARDHHDKVVLPAATAGWHRSADGAAAAAVQRLRDQGFAELTFPGKSLHEAEAVAVEVLKDLVNHTP